MHLKYWNFQEILCIMHVKKELEFPRNVCTLHPKYFILRTLHQNATLAAEKAHEQTTQKPNGGKVV